MYGTIGDRFSFPFFVNKCKEVIGVKMENVYKDIYMFRRDAYREYLATGNKIQYLECPFCRSKVLFDAAFWDDKQMSSAGCEKKCFTIHTHFPIEE